jgi:acid-sensing ion channel, other
MSISFSVTPINQTADDFPTMNGSLSRHDDKTLFLLFMSCLHSLSVSFLSFPQIPFPAVTICPESKTDVDKFNVSQVLEKIHSNETLTKEERKKYEAIFQVCDIIDHNPTQRTFVPYIVRTLRDISNDFASFSSVKIAQFPKTFESVFKKMITSNGVCYTYNMLDAEDLYNAEMAHYLRTPVATNRSDWTIFGYNNFDSDTYPSRVLGSGKEAELEITLKMKKKNVDFACKSSANGFRLTLHTPDELPQTMSHFHRIPFNVETLISIEPKVMATSKNLRHYQPGKRQCYYSKEKKLKFFKSYSQMNCKLECFVGRCLDVSEMFLRNPSSVFSCSIVIFLIKISF